MRVVPNGAFKTTGSNADPFTIAFLSLLSYSYYLTGEFKFSREYAEQGMIAYQKLSNIGKEFKEYVDRSEKILFWIERWKDEPILVDLKKLEFVLNHQTMNAQQQLNIHTIQAIPLTITSSSSKVKARFLSDGAGRKQEYGIARTVIVEVTAEAMETGAEAILEIQSPQISDFRQRVPVSVQVPNQIRYPTLVYFRNVKVGSEEVRVLKLTAPMPFRILKLEYSIDNKAINNKTLQATLTLNREIAEHHVELKYRPTVPNQSCTGKSAY
jgi:hypothetical protein